MNGVSTIEIEFTLLEFLAVEEVSAEVRMELKVPAEFSGPKDRLSFYLSSNTKLFQSPQQQ